ncbi:MAG: hypothetical protein ACOZQL_22930 [Myxococcota bacterium]
MSAERVACKRCGKWMFHLAVSCPHCGARADGAKPAAEAAPPPKTKPELKLSPEEARSLLAASAGGPSGGATIGEVAAEMVLPRAGAAELVLTVLAAPLTVATVAVLGYLLVRERRSRREGKLEGARTFGVPAVAALIAVSLWGSAVPAWSWWLLGGAFAAWLAREVLRASTKRDPLL